MTLTILAQTIEYDQSAGAWGRYAPDATLLKHHDSIEDAMLAALPEDLQEWAEIVGTKLGPKFRKRVIKGAALVARDRETPCIKGNPLSTGDHFRITSDSGKTYTVNLPPNQRCTCDDFMLGGAPFLVDFATGQHRRIYCKHIFALSAYMAMLVKQADSLWNLAQKTINYKQVWPVDKPWIIWSKGERYAALTRLQSEPDDGPYARTDALYLTLSGHARPLRVAILRNSTMTNEPYFQWSCDPTHYKLWANQAKNG